MLKWGGGGGVWTPPTLLRDTPKMTHGAVQVCVQQHDGTGQRVHGVWGGHGGVKMGEEEGAQGGGLKWGSPPQNPIGRRTAHHHGAIVEL